MYSLLATGLILSVTPSMADHLLWIHKLVVLPVATMSLTLPLAVFQLKTLHM